MQGTGPAPAKEMPTSLINTDEPTSTPWAGQKHDGPTIEALPPPPTVTPLHALGDTPQPIDCPFCKKRTQTTITKEGTSMQIPTTTTPPVEQEKGADHKPGPPMIQGVTPLHMLGGKPQPIDCPFCMRRTMTIVDTEGTGMQMLAGALCCLLCVCLTCVPCIAGWYEDTHYSCGNCHKRVATRPYDGPIQVFGPHGQMFPMVPSQYEPIAPPVAEQQSPPVYK
ncbi:hypothetical protein CGLO_00429 [Colletotrichum gloeosporioides Cg-14]|uniref:LITAF domain-containing protein n=1 Tax=Colletotrichum gloeosporioides (strain Cg-14) TaxID=1237896 RepID=T0KUK6_COLGC|nr:hypothetical protein CGLO_00429 [Colletotrichum gloeosporioides Cg-14]